MDATKSRRPAMAAVGCAIILATGIGSTSVLNAITPLLIEGMGTTVTDYAFGPMLATIFAFVGSLIGAKFITRIGARKCLLIGTVCVTVVLCLIATATNTVLWYVANVINGVVLAIGAHAAAAGVLAEHYGPRTPSVFGVVIGVMSFLVAGEVFVESLMLGAMDYRTIVYVFAAAVLVLGLFSNLVLIGKLPSERAKGAAASAPEAAPGDAPAPEAAGAEQAEEPAGITLHDALRSPALYLFFLAMVLASFPINGYSAYASYFFVDGMTASFAATLLSVFAVIVALISLVSGTVSKKLGASVTSVIIFVGFAAGVFLMVTWTSNGALPIAFASLVLCALIGPVQILPALFIPQLFGMKDYTSINAFGMGGFYLGGAAVFVIVAAVMQNLGFNMGFIVLAGCGVAALVLFLLAIATSPIKRMKKPQAARDRRTCAHAGGRPRAGAAGLNLPQCERRVRACGSANRQSGSCHNTYRGLGPAVALTACPSPPPQAALLLHRWGFLRTGALLPPLLYFLFSSSSRPHPPMRPFPSCKGLLGASRMQ